MFFAALSGIILGSQYGGHIGWGVFFGLLAITDAIDDNESATKDIKFAIYELKKVIKEKFKNENSKG